MLVSWMSLGISADAFEDPQSLVDPPLLPPPPPTAPAPPPPPTTPNALPGEGEGLWREVEGGVEEYRLGGCVMKCLGLEGGRSGAGAGAAAAGWW